MTPCVMLPIFEGVTTGTYGLRSLLAAAALAALYLLAAICTLDLLAIVVEIVVVEVLLGLRSLPLA